MLYDFSFEDSSGMVKLHASSYMIISDFASQV